MPQNAQNRDGTAIQAKLDELIRASIRKAQRLRDEMRAAIEAANAVRREVANVLSASDVEDASHVRRSRLGTILDKGTQTAACRPCKSRNPA